MFSFVIFNWRVEEWVTNRFKCCNVFGWINAMNCSPSMVLCLMSLEIIFWPIFFQTASRGASAFLGQYRAHSELSWGFDACIVYIHHAG